VELPTQLVPMQDTEIQPLTGNVPYGSNTILFSAGFSGSAYTEYWKIWIDYNKNGVLKQLSKLFLVLRQVVQT
jgi:hypothetical protein